MTKPTTFLLVDDDIDDSSLFEEILHEVDPTVKFVNAPDGQAALDLLRKSNGNLPDLIFLDLNMPKMDGKQCLLELKADAGLAKIPVIMYTTSSQSRDIEQTMMHGAICFITKPTDIRELRNIITSITRNIHKNLESTLKSLSNSSNTFIVC